MIFTSTETAARIERAECGLLAEGAEAAGRRHPDPLVEPIGGGVAICTVAGSPFNKIAGLGFGGAVSEAELDHVERSFAARGIPVQAEVSCLADPSVGELLTRRGYVLRGFENVLGRRLPVENTASCAGDIEVSSIEPERAPVWIDIFMNGFAAADTQGVPSHEDFPLDVLEQVAGDLVVSTGFLQYLAHRGGEPAGIASMRLHEGIAQLCGSTTLPAHRRRGVHTAMLTHRLAEAGRAGCDLAVVTVQPGSKSHENAQRRGFDLLYSRAMLVRDA